MRVLNFFKGLTFPLIGNSFIVGTHFYVYNNYKNTMPAFCVGGLAGLCSSFIVNPVELIRIKMQLSDKMSNNKKYKNSFVCMKNIIQHNGIIGLFKGQLSTSLRDIIGYGSFFYIYSNYQSTYSKIFGLDHYYKYELLNKMI